MRFTADGLEFLENYPWYGNIRELKNLVERAVLMKSPAATELTPADFQLGAQPAASSSDAVASRQLSQVERDTIAACISRNGGNLSLTAKELGISRGALYRKIEKYGL